MAIIAIKKKGVALQPKNVCGIQQRAVPSAEVPARIALHGNKISAAVQLALCEGGVDHDHRRAADGVAPQRGVVCELAEDGPAPPRRVVHRCGREADGLRVASDESDTLCP